MIPLHRPGLRRWLIRLAFSFYILAFALFFTGQARWRNGDRGWRPAVLVSAAIACVMVGSVGVRLRHQKPPAGGRRPDEKGTADEHR